MAGSLPGKPEGFSLEALQEQLRSGELYETGELQDEPPPESVKEAKARAWKHLRGLVKAGKLSTPSVHAAMSGFTRAAAGFAKSTGGLLKAMNDVAKAAKDFEDTAKKLNLAFKWDKACERCGYKPAAETPSMTAYDWDGEGEDPNKNRFYCASCAQEHVDVMEGQWADYYHDKL